MKRNENDTLQFIWASYCYKTSRALKISTQVERWAKDIAQPYLLRNSPSSLHIDVSDPRQARKLYNEPELMELDNDNSTNSSNTKPAAKEDGWMEVKRRNRASRSDRETHFYSLNFCKYVLSAVRFPVLSLRVVSVSSTMTDLAVLLQLPASTTGSVRAWFGRCQSIPLSLAGRAANASLVVTATMDARVGQSRCVPDLLPVSFPS